MNVDYLSEILLQHPSLKTPLEEVKAKVTGQYQSYNDFLNRLMTDIDSVIDKMERGRNYYQEHSEDAISFQIVNMLQSMGYSADHGVCSSGETDIRVVHGSCEWIGEAKKHTQDEDIREGMLQLSTRYSDGGQNKCHGGLLIYNFTRNIKEKIERMREYWANDCVAHENIRVRDCQLSQAAFFTVHTHQSSGEDYTVRHRWVNLHYNPEDKSARGRKNK